MESSSSWVFQATEHIRERIYGILLQEKPLGRGQRLHRVAEWCMAGPDSLREPRYLQAVFPQRKYLYSHIATVVFIYRKSYISDLIILVKIALNSCHRSVLGSRLEQMTRLRLRQSLFTAFSGRT